MDLNFIQDIYHPYDEVVIRYRDELLIGTILKLNSEMIALKKEDGSKIVINGKDINYICSLTMPSASIISKTNEKTILYTEKEKNEEEIKIEVIGSTMGSWSVYDSILPQLLLYSELILNNTPNNEKNTTIPANAYVVRVSNSSFQVSTTQNYNQRVRSKAIVEKKLWDDISHFERGDMLPVIIYFNPQKQFDAILALTSSTIGDIEIMLNESIKKKHYHHCKILCRFLLNYVKIGNTTCNKALRKILSLLRNVNEFQGSIPNIKFEKLNPKRNKGLNNLFVIEKNIKELGKTGEYSQIIKVINNFLENEEIDVRIKHNLLLKKAQTYVSLNSYKNAINTYIELIESCEANHDKERNLSSLYEQLAHVVLNNSPNKDEAILLLKKSLEYNNKNSSAISLLEQLESGNSIFTESTTHFRDDEKLQIEQIITKVIISPLLVKDINEWEFKSDCINENKGISSVDVANELLDQAKDAKLDTSGRCLLYLEAAKAYSELPQDSFDFSLYTEALASYSILKANTLFLQIQDLVTNDYSNIDHLRKIVDCASCYYLESLPLLTSKMSGLLITALCNYLKIKMALLQYENNSHFNFSGRLNNKFFECLNNSKISIREIAWELVLEVGASNLECWNNMFKIDHGFSGLYSYVNSSEKKMEVYNIIISLCNLSYDYEIASLEPCDFFNYAFNFRREHKQTFMKVCNSILQKPLDLRMMNSWADQWDKLNDYIILLTESDRKSKQCGDSVMRILQPYLSRNRNERTSILIQAHRLLKKQIENDSEYQTLYGKIFFYPLFQKWGKTIEALIDSKIAETLPQLEVIADPPYIVSKDDKYYVHLLVRNIGDNTAEGFIIMPSFVCGDKKIIAKKEISEELPAGNVVEIPLNLPPALTQENSVSLIISVVAIFQGKELNSKDFSFTIAPEPKSFMRIEDIPWRDGPIPKEQMFKGRQQILTILFHHYMSIERDKPYILYGLTRTGKSSILEYFGRIINKQEFDTIEGKSKFAIFKWELNQAASMGGAQDMWHYLLYDQIFCCLEDYLGKEVEEEFFFTEQPGAGDFYSILLFLKSKHIFPLILVDEFSFIKMLLDEKMINSAFLHSIRQYSFDGLASFIFAGTYDIKLLIKDKKYGITGQLVNTIELQISEIDSKSAEELMSVIDNKLHFTKEAIAHIHKLSGDIPYFIQMICKNCGYFAVENKRSIIGYPELEYVIRILTGEDESTKETENSMLKELPESVFQNNMHSPGDPKEVNVLLTCIADFNRTCGGNARGVSITELQELWKNKDVQQYQSKLSEAIELLIEKKVLLQYEDEGTQVYKITVDLFRRWWGQHHKDIIRELNTII